jgi:hypothetical protein
VFKRTVLKWVALYLPLHWPAGVMTRPEVDQEFGGTPPADFAADVDELVRRVHCLTDRRPDSQWAAEHPFFGRMSDAEWLRWAYLHIDHHLRQFGA